MLDLTRVARVRQRVSVAGADLCMNGLRLYDLRSARTVSLTLGLTPECVVGDLRLTHQLGTVDHLLSAICDKGGGGIREAGNGRPPIRREGGTTE